MMISRGTGYVKGVDRRATAKLGAHIRYLQHRSGDDERQEPRSIYGPDGENIDRADAVQDIREHGDNYVAYHKIVLSPSAEEREGIEDWQQWTRDVMGDFEERKGQDLTWYAVYHDNTDDPHVHVILAGRGEDGDGDERTVRMYRDDYQALDEMGKDRADLEHMRLAHETIRADESLEREQGYGGDISRGGERTENGFNGPLGGEIDR